uniref:Mitotic deacetylase associated SANT domain protein a n=1 Tax=Maylandia zebra TaxID=106582 RepID=A0A3P9DS31_9CICH
MSLPAQVNTDKSGKHRAAAMKEAVQHPGEVYYGMGPPALESSHSDSASSSGVYNQEKGPQSLPHYQQGAPVKWMHQDSLQAPGWSQEVPVSTWGQNFGPYMSGVNVRNQMTFHKGVHEGVALPMGGENQLSGPVEVYRDATQAPAQGRGIEWEQHAAAAAMHQAQLQAYQHGHKGVELQGQSHVPPHGLQGSMLQPFQATFRPSKQQFSSGYYSVFPANKAIPNLPYSEQPKTQQQLLHQMQQQQQQQQQQQIHHHHHHQQQQQQQQQQLHQQHQIQLQQQQQQQQHLQQQQHQIQQHQIQQLQQQMQQQYQQQQQLQERQQQIQQMQQQQQLQQQNVSQQDTTQPQVQPKQQQTQNFVAYQPAEPPPSETGSKEDVQSTEPQQEAEAQSCDASAVPDQCPEKAGANPTEPANAAAPRRSRRLSREGQSPLDPPSTNIWSQAKEPPPPQNGVAGAQVAKAGESQVTTGGVIRRRRRASKEINLETLAQKASEMESLPAKIVKEDGASSRQATMVPLVIPVSVPVHRGQTDPQGGWAQGRPGQGERPAAPSDRKPSVIVARRRSLRSTMTESFAQDEESDTGLDEDGKAKLKRRPRPEPLIIPPPKPSTFIAPSVYSSITSFQSNLRSPVRLMDNPLTFPPYTPPPILSPVREGSGLYFSTFLTNIAVTNQILPPPPTPKSAARSLLRSTSSDVTPPSFTLNAEATPVSLEPRINIGQKYQAEIPDLQDEASSQSAQHKADLVWVPTDDAAFKHGDKETMEDLMNMACSSVLRGGGTNQELALHCFHECGGDFLETLGRLMHQDPIFPKGHQLIGYHYSGSDSWTAEEKRFFNKGISAYRKDFFLVQKLVRTKTVAQCVEFYYTYKKQVKVGRNGILMFGPPDSSVEKHAEAVVDVKSSQQPKMTQGEADEDDKKNMSLEQINERKQQARVAQSLQVHDYAGTVLVLKEPDTVHKEAHQSPALPRSRAEPAAKKPRVPLKPSQEPEQIFPCKKCNRYDKSHHRDWR